MTDPQLEVFQRGLEITPINSPSSVMAITIKLVDNDHIQLVNDATEMTLTMEQAVVAALAIMTIAPEDSLPDLDGDDSCPTGECSIDFDDPLN